VSAKSRVETSLNALNNAQSNYDEKVKEHGERINSQLQSAETNVRNAESNVRNAEIDLEKRQTDYNNSKILFENGTVSQNEFENAELALTNSQNALKDAQDALEDAQQNFETVKTNTGIDQDSELRALSQALETSRLNYEDALANLESVRLGLTQSIERYEESVKTAEIARDSNSDLIAIENLETRLAKAKCVSPIDGTITAVYAKKGASASGLMFVVEDTENLRIDARLKEFDSARVKEDMEVIITSDATGDEEYEGRIFKIAPTSVKNAVGEPDTSSDVEFETEIKVVSRDTGLKIGMNAKLTIILERRQDILYVPFEALGSNDNGDDVVYVLNSAGSDGAGALYTAVETLVDVLLETDFYAQIEGEGISEGVYVASSSSGLTNGATVRIAEPVGGEALE
jgi:multidrug resistance efflux pump